MSPYSTNATHSSPPNRSSPFRIGSLNCRSLTTPSKPDTSANFIHYLHKLEHDVLCLQETHITPELQPTIEMQFQSSSTCWTKHCGIVSLNPNLQLHPILITRDQRLIVCRITHVNAHFPLILVCNIYAPAQSRERQVFFHSILSLPIFQDTSFRSASEATYIDAHFGTESDTDTQSHYHDTPMIILGDFNYHTATYATDSSDYSRAEDISPSPLPTTTSTLNDTSTSISPQKRWHELLTNNFFECTHSREDGPLIPTFRRGSSKSIIDYLYASSFLHQKLHSSSVDFISNAWMDHAFLSARFIMALAFGGLTLSWLPTLTLLKLFTVHWILSIFHCLSRTINIPFRNNGTNSNHSSKKLLLPAPVERVNGANDFYSVNNANEIR